MARGSQRAAHGPGWVAHRSEAPKVEARKAKRERADPAHEAWQRKPGALALSGEDDGAKRGAVRHFGAVQGWSSRAIGTPSAVDLMFEA